MNILVSSCLLGANAKYSGGNNLSPKVLELMKEHNLIPVCPEQLGGLTTPREPSEIQEGDGSKVLEGKARVMTVKGEDVTPQFVKGAEEALYIAQLYGCKAAILKANSPSCGCGTIYEGTFSGRHKEGSGVTAQLLMDNGILAIVDNEIENRLEDLR